MTNVTFSAVSVDDLFNQVKETAKEKGFDKVHQESDFNPNAVRGKLAFRLCDSNNIDNIGFFNLMFLKSEDDGNYGVFGSFLNTEDIMALLLN